MRPVLTLLLCMLTTACVSSASYERLERQNQLLTIERDNLRTDKQQLQREAKSRDGELSRLEQRLGERDVESEDLKRTLQTLSSAEKRSATALSQLRELALSYKQWIMAHGYESKPGAKELMKRTDELAPPAPAPEAAPAKDAKVTH